MDGVIDDVYDHRADVGVICLTDLTEKIICRLLDARELEFHELAAVCPCIYVRGGHPLAGRSSVTEEELDGYPYVAFEHDQGVASDFFEEYPMVSLKKPAKCISVNNRATAMYVLASTDAFTSGSGLLSEGLADGSVVTIPLLGKTSVHLGWIHIRSSRPSPLTEQFVRLLEEALADSIAFTRRLQEGT
ncbi:LysR family transcriptional regulator substrate-binding protein [Dysosmobacter welbionis]